MKKKILKITLIIILVIIASCFLQYSFALGGKNLLNSGPKTFKEESTGKSASERTKLIESVKDQVFSEAQKLVKEALKKEGVETNKQFLPKDWLNEPGTEHPNVDFEIEEGKQVSLEIKYNYNEFDRIDNKDYVTATLEKLIFNFDENDDGKSDVSGEGISPNEHNKIDEEVDNEAHSTEDERFPHGWETMPVVGENSIDKWFLNGGNASKLDQEVKDNWIERIRDYMDNNNISQGEAGIWTNRLRALGWSEDDEMNDQIYHKIGINTTDTSHSLDDAMGDAESFVNSGNSVISTSDLQQFSQSLYNILLTIGIIIAVIMGGILGIKFMTEAPEGKAEVKKLLIPYVVGCVIVFGGFTIWKIVVIVLGNM